MLVKTPNMSARFVPKGSILVNSTLKFYSNFDLVYDLKNYDILYVSRKYLHTASIKIDTRIYASKIDALKSVNLSYKRIGLTNKYEYELLYGETVEFVDFKHSPHTAPKKPYMYFYERAKDQEIVLLKRYIGDLGKDYFISIDKGYAKMDKKKLKKYVYEHRKNSDESIEKKYGIDRDEALAFISIFKPIRWNELVEIKPYKKVPYPLRRFKNIALYSLLIDSLNEGCPGIVDLKPTIMINLYMSIIRIYDIRMLI